MNKTVAILMLIALFLAAPFAKNFMHYGVYGQAEEMPVPTLEQKENTLIVHEDMGGAMTNYLIRYNDMRQHHAKLQIDGECDSACTLFFGFIPRDDVCVTANAKLGFHRASRPEGTMVMMGGYPLPVIMWILAEGITEDIKYMPDGLLHFLFTDCPLPPAGEKVE